MNMMNKRVKSLMMILGSLGYVLCLGGVSAEEAARPEAVGKVAWLRDLPRALALSKKTGKPVFLLFQEVPGCAGCRQFGRDVLSDPEVVRAVEQHFVPLLIPNNQPGGDAEVLRRYDEPSWNYQVVRFIDAEGRDLIPRKDRVWTTPELATRMVASLEKAGRDADDGLRRLAGLRLSGKAGKTEKATPDRGRERVAFAQACFWTGEMRLGQIEGVVRTEAGFFQGREVTLVEYQPDAISLGDLVREALARQCAESIFVASESQKKAALEAAEGRSVGLLDASYLRAPESDQKKQIQGTSAEGRVLTADQATKVNAFIRSDPARAAAYLPIK
ncbi:MAG: VPGUxxT family thioredoxin-like (seleno)protein, type 2 [Candidatus Methylacidiphilales bacterium]|nr:VPGUxxT family thioredoxin-like (seleno)protein, type 2 [Candidatus Methylacidiphilales bacterium]